jgi:2-keto-4-pentenoate hydratase
MKVWEDPRIARGVKAQLEERRARIAKGEKPLGWKLGFGAPASMERLKIAAPLSGYLMQSSLLPSGATVNVKGWTQPIAEPEIGVRLNADLAPGSSQAAALATVASLTPAVELVDLTFAANHENADAVLAHNIYQRHVVLSEQSRDGGSTAGLASRVFRRGKLAAEAADPEALTGKLPDLLVHLADLLGAFGEKLHAGDLVICGSTVPPPMIEPDETDFDYTLEPIGSVSVRFTR